jgi:ribosomal protein S18 acetylase RimI-like enzyme
VEFRQATIDDVPHLTRFTVTAQGGLQNAIYEGLFPDQSIESALTPRYSGLGRTDSYENHWVAIHEEQVAGGALAFPFDNYELDPPPDPRIPEERFAVFQPFSDLPAPGTYYIGALAVYPEFCRKGLGLSLLSLVCDHARSKNFSETSLHVFAENSGALALYQKAGFKIVGRQPVIEHPLVCYTGDVLLMTVAV